VRIPVNGLVVVVGVIFALGLAPDQAIAQDQAPAPAQEESNSSPWNKDVSVAQRDEAQGIFEKGNYHFERSGYSKALAEYRKAIVLWNHPAIRYNMAICLMQLDQPIEAAGHLEKSLHYGEKPLGRRLFSEGQLHQKNLAARLSVVEVATKDAGARVTLDGEELFTGPGSAERTVLAKKHQIVASKEGMLTLTKDFIPEAGEVSKIKIKLVPLSESNVVLVRRWDTWKPWAVMGGGVVVGAIGGTFYLLTARNVDAYDQGIAAACPSGCSTDSQVYRDLKHKKDRGALQNKVMVGSLVAGGLALSTGVVLLFLNRPRVQHLGGSSGDSGPQVSLNPLWGHHGTGALTELHWQF
jgi:hypothetical protein